MTAASDSNFVIEGDDATTDAPTTTVRLYNYTAISDKVARVTGTQESMNAAGRKSDMAHQMANRMKELKRDVEKILMANTAYVAGNDSTARKCAGLQSWIKTNTSIGAGATAATGNGSDAHTDDASPRAIQESFVETVLASCWTNGGVPSLGFLNAYQKGKFAYFDGNATRINDGTKKKIINSVDIYIDPLGTEVRLVPCRQCPTDVVYFIDPEYVAFSTLRDFRTAELAKTGDSERKQILVEYTMEMRNEKAHGGIYDLAAA